MSDGGELLEVIEDAHVGVRNDTGRALCSAPSSPAGTFRKTVVVEDLKNNSAEIEQIKVSIKRVDLGLTAKIRTAVKRCHEPNGCYTRGGMKVVWP